MGSTHSYECTMNETLTVLLPNRVPLYLYNDSQRIVITILNPIILAIGLIGNLAFLFVMMRIPRMKTITNLYLANLAVADIIFLSVNVGDKLGRYLASPIMNDQYPIGPVGCICIYLIANASQWTALYLITMVTLERYYATCKPIQHRLIGSRKRTVRIIIFGWLMALCLACSVIPAFANFQYWCFSWPDGKLGGKDYSYLPPVHGFCQPIASWCYPFFNGMQALPFIVALIANVYMYIRIMSSVMHHTQIQPSNVTSAGEASDSRHNQRARIRNQITKMLLINAVVFCVCVSPFHFTSFVAMITGAMENYAIDDPVKREMHYMVIRAMLYINSMVNPYIYTIINPRYRQAFKEAFCGCFMAKKSPNNSTNIEMNTAVTAVTDHKP